MLRSLAIALALVAASAGPANADSFRRAHQQNFVFFGASPLTQPFALDSSRFGSFHRFDNRFGFPSFEGQQHGSVLLLVPQQRSFIIERKFGSFDTHRQFLLRPFSPSNPSVLVITPNHFVSPMRPHQNFVFFGASPFTQFFAPDSRRLGSHRRGSVLLLVPQQRSFIIERKFGPFDTHRQFFLQPLSPSNPSVLVVTPNHFVSRTRLFSVPGRLQFASVFNPRLGSTFLVVLPPCKPARIAVFD